MSGGGLAIVESSLTIASEVSNSSKDSLAITDFFAKKIQVVHHCEYPVPGTSPFSPKQDLPPFVERAKFRPRS